MKTKPILFSTPMVQALLAGRKTITRRVKGLAKVNENPANWYFQSLVLHASGRYTFAPLDVPTNLIDESCIFFAKLPYAVGDILWVRETTVQSELFRTIYAYKANYTEEQLKTKPACVKWKPSIFMPKEAARIFLKVTDIKVERLQYISEEDAIAEGIECLGENKTFKWKDYIAYGGWCNPIISFSTLWISINGIESWDSNPWVIAYTFERIEKPEGF